MALRQISAAQARRTALAAQGFGRPVPPGGVTARQLLRVVDDVAVVHAVRAAGFPVFGPSGAAARIEGSKAFAKDVMAAAGVAMRHSV